MHAAITTTLAQQLQEGAHRLGLADRVQAAQQQKLLDYMGLIQKWNKVYNLTAVRDPEEMLTHHLLDSLAMVGPLAQWLEQKIAQKTAQNPAHTSAVIRLLDVGSGAGLPGVILAIGMPSLAVTCVDAVGKKAAFIRQVASELALPNLQSRHARVEDLLAMLDSGLPSVNPRASGERLQPRFDVIVSRAFSTLTDLVRATKAIIQPQGIWIAMKSQLQGVAREVAQLQEAQGAEACVFHVEPIQVPFLDEQRCLVWMAPKLCDYTIALPF